MVHPNLPHPQGLYDGGHEHDACGVGFIANIKGKKSHDIVEQGLTILRNLTHRGAVGADPKASRMRSRSCRTSSTAALWAPIPCPATVPAS